MALRGEVVVVDDAYTLPTDGWLHHRLDGIQQRFGDAAEFERVLHAHAGTGASWTDRVLAEELLQPFSWLRRLCLVACPGLPGRTGALARALHAADPESSSTRLNAKTHRFWERATNRNALHRERFAFMATRLALWAALISGLSKSRAPCFETPMPSQISWGVRLLASRSICSNCSCLGRSTSFLRPDSADSRCTRVHTFSSVARNPSAVYSSQLVKSPPGRRAISRAA